MIFTFQAAQKVLGVKSEDPLKRQDWLTVQSNRWELVWIWPSIFMFVLLVFFAVAFRDNTV